MDKIGAPPWKIEKIVSKGSYNYCVVRGHPNATRHGYVLHHRIVVENSLLRILDSNEVVHHIDGNKKNNSLANLEVMSKSKHTRQHQIIKGRKFLKMKCPNCGSVFDIPENQSYLYKGGKFNCCSRSCRSSFSRKIHLHGITERMEIAISENIRGRFKKFADNTEET